MVEIIPDETGLTGWTQQRLGCGQPGDKLTLPYSQLANQSTSHLGNLWLRLRYGVFSDLDGSGSEPTSRQFSECEGRSVSEVIMSHPDFSEPRPPSSFNPPHFRLVQTSLPRIILLLENSAAMNQANHWESIRTACKKLILHDLPEEVQLALVLYNEEAHISLPVRRLGKKTISPTRNELAFSIRNKHNLSPSNGSCVTCGLLKAVEALQGSGGVSRGGVVVMVGRAEGTGGGATREEEGLVNLSLKHRLQVYPVVVPGELSRSRYLEDLAHRTGAYSFVLHNNPLQSLYMDLNDALRVIQENIIPNSNRLVCAFFCIPFILILLIFNNFF